MTYANLMVNVEVGRPNAGLLEIACSLAERFKASLTGIAANQPAQIFYGADYLPSNFIDEQRDELEKRLQVLEEQFRNALGGRIPNVEWRAASTYAPLASYFAQQARSTDLFITGVDRDRSLFEASRNIGAGELVMEIGRPVLLVPSSARSLMLDHVMIAWRDTREARLATSMALPMLKAAAHVSIVGLAPVDELAEVRANLKDVSAWLGTHGVAAEAIASISNGNDADGLNVVADRLQVDLIVAGAYGHSRLRESVLGGVTRDLLLHAQRCALVAH